MRFAFILSLLFTSSAFALTCRSNEGVEVQISGSQVTSISAPVRVVSKWGQSEILGTDLEVEGTDCNEGSSVRFDSNENLLIATCRVDSGPTMWYSAPVTCN